MNKVYQKIKTHFSVKIGLSLFAALCACHAVAADLSVSVNKNTVGLNEQIRLVIKTDEVTARSPDLSKIEEVFTVMGTSQSTQIQIINGDAIKSRSWVITLAPKELGKTTIPALEVGNEHSNPITIDVVKGDTVAATHQGSIDVAATIEEGDVHVFQEVPLKLTIISSKPLLEGDIVTPHSKDVEITQSASDIVREEIRDNKKVTVIERQYIVRPQKAGDISLPPFVFRGYLLKAHQDPFDDPFATRGFDDFFSSPFGRNRRGEAFVAKSQPLTISVQSAPSIDAGEWFLPAKNVSLTDDFNPRNPVFRVGEAVTRTIRLVALGARAEQLPPLDITDVDGLKQYTDNDETAMQQSPRGTQALREVQVSIVPTRAGVITLPEISVVWFNTETNQQETATLPARTLTVEGNVPQVVASQTTTAQPNPSVTQQSQNNVGHNKEHESQTPLDTGKEAKKLTIWEKINSLTMQNWLVISALIAVLIFKLTFMYVVWTRRKKFAHQHSEPQSQAHAKTIQSRASHVMAIERAVQKQSLQETYQLILQWQNQGETFIPSLQEQVDRLEQHYFGVNEEKNVDWSAFSLAIKEQITQSSHKSSEKNQDQLPPLY